MERLSDNAIEIVNELHTERLAYESEYVPIIDALNRLAEYEDMEEQGLLLRLPCRVGNRVYRVIDDCTFPGDCGTTRLCKGCEYRNLFIEKLHSVCIYLLMTGSYDEVTTAPVKKLKRYWRKYARIHRTRSVKGRFERII